MDNDIERADIVERKGKETVFKGAGNSHFSFIEGKGFQVTTEVPGMKQDCRIPVHDPIIFYPPHM